MRIPSGKTDQLIYFVAVDSTDLKTRETGLTGFTVYRSRNGGAATAYTTPTVAELSAGNMPGVYTLTVDEDTTLAAGSDSEEYCVHITQASMAPVTRAIELYRRDTTTGTTITTTDIAAIKTKTDFLPSVTAGAAGGVFIAGSNAATTAATWTVTGATTHTGNVAMAAGLTVTQSTSNGHGISVTGNGTGHGALLTSGSGATGSGLRCVSNATVGHGLNAEGKGGGGAGMLLTTPTAFGYGLYIDAPGANGTGIQINSAAVGFEIQATTTGMLVNATAGDGVFINGTEGHGVVIISASATATDHGLLVSCSGDGDGIKAQNVGTGVNIRGNIVGNITGNLSGSVNSVTTAVGITSNIKQNQALANFEFLMTNSTTHLPSTGLTVSVTRSIDGAAFGAGTLSVVTEVSNGIYRVDFAAADLNGKVVVLRATAAASDDTFERIITQV